MPLGTPPPLEIDGSHGEGGGQVLRTAVFLATVTGQPFHMHSIRAGRPKPGLKPQHLGVLKVLKELTGCRVEGAKLGSPTITLWPGRPEAGANVTYDIGTAGSMTLFLQALFPVMLLAPRRTKLRLMGGTDVAWSPTLDWWRHVYLPIVEVLSDGGAKGVAMSEVQRGYYPKGGGRLRIQVDGALDEGWDLDDVHALVGRRLGRDRLDRGREVELFQGTSISHEDLADQHVTRRQLTAARRNLFAEGLPTPTIEEHLVDAANPGSSVTLWLVDDAGNRMGWDAIGARDRRAEEVGELARAALVEDWRTDATVDRWQADQLVPWVALGAGAYRVPRVTGHVATNAWVCQRFLGEEAVVVDGDTVRGGRA